MNEYRFKYLKSYLDRRLPLYDLSIINISQNGWILILHGEMLLIYGDNWNRNQFDEIKEIFELNNFTNFTLAGDNDLISELIHFYKPRNFTIDKRRLFYKSKTIEKSNNENLKIKLGSMNQLNELAKMLKEYYHEEYYGQNDKEINDMQERIIGLIRTKKIYILIDKNDTILSFCSINDPDIGILFTNRDYRNKGYAKIILSHCSQLLLEKNKMVYLMTDEDKPESNHVCKDIGLKPYFKYIMITINNSEN